MWPKVAAVGVYEREIRSVKVHVGEGSVPFRYQSNQTKCEGLHVRIQLEKKPMQKAG